MQIKFGKHKGKTLQEVPENWLHWARENFEDDTDEKKTLIQAIDAEINRRTDSKAQKPAPMAVNHEKELIRGILADLRQAADRLTESISDLETALQKNDQKVPY